MSAQVYRCLVRSATGQTVPVDVKTETGDEAAAKALEGFVGGFVTNVTPAPQSAQDVPKKAA